MQIGLLIVSNWRSFHEDSKVPTKVLIPQAGGGALVTCLHKTYQILSFSPSAKVKPSSSQLFVQTFNFWQRLTAHHARCFLLGILTMTAKLKDIEHLRKEVKLRIRKRLSRQTLFRQVVLLLRKMSPHSKMC